MYYDLTVVCEREQTAAASSTHPLSVIEIAITAKRLAFPSRRQTVEVDVPDVPLNYIRTYMIDEWL
jgi:hypothetical protein